VEATLWRPCFERAVYYHRVAQFVATKTAISQQKKQAEGGFLQKRVFVFGKQNIPLPCLVDMVHSTDTNRSHGIVSAVLGMQ